MARIRHVALYVFQCAVVYTVIIKKKDKKRFKKNLASPSLIPSLDAPVCVCVCARAHVCMSHEHTNTRNVSACVCVHVCAHNVCIHTHAHTRST